MKIEHYGERLQKEITDKGYSKKKICACLGISYNTLMLRLIDGDFTRDQVSLLVKNRYI